MAASKPTIETTPSTAERAALHWLANRLRWEATLELMRSNQTAATEKAA